MTDWSSAEYNFVSGKLSRFTDDAMRYWIQYEAMYRANTN